MRVLAEAKFSFCALVLVIQVVFENLCLLWKALKPIISKAPGLKIMK